MSLKGSLHRTTLLLLMSSIFQVYEPTQALASSAEKKAPAWSIVQGVGLGFSPSSTRLGIGAWEFGLLHAGSNLNSFGFVRMFRHSVFYSSLGVIALNAMMLGITSPGLFAGVGMQVPLGLNFFGRVELSSEMTFDNASQSASTLALGWGWE